MRFEINPRRSLSEEIPHLMAVQIARIEAHLREKESDEDRIHEVRRRIKETRALLRLVRDPLGPQFAVENDGFRAMAHTLSAARDAAALVASARKLRRHSHDRDAARQIGRVIRALNDANNDAADVAQRITKALQDVDDARDRLAKWPSLRNKFATIGAGFQRTFRDGRRALRDVRHDATAENFHELRKRVKDHWYHAQLLRRVSPDVMEHYAEVVEALSDALGDHHDLIVLRQTLNVDPATYGGEQTLQGAFSAIEQRRKQLEKKALRVAEPVYAENAAAWRDRIKAWWNLAAGR